MWRYANVHNKRMVTKKGLRIIGGLIFCLHALGARS
nr:MAG TPA: hypothetical protein [Caudoviricetes sp.]